MHCFNNYLNESNSCNNINFDCDACSICNVNSELDQCPIVIFKDITKYKLPKSDPYWHSWKHSGYPYSNWGTPLFVDINNDGVLDMFNSMHGHPMDKDRWNRMELGESVLYNFTGDGVVPSADASDPNIMRFRSISDRIIITDAPLAVDLHGENIIDLDGDGVEDLMISSGGGKGKTTSIG